MTATPAGSGDYEGVALTPGVGCVVRIQAKDAYESARCVATPPETGGSDFLARKPTSVGKLYGIATVAQIDEYPRPSTACLWYFGVCDVFLKLEATVHIVIA